MKHRRMFTILIILSLTLSGCSLAPKEEVLPEAPVIPIGNVEDYELVEVLRGDIIESLTVDCTYTAFQTEELNFQVSGIRLDHVYIKEGDLVKKGDLLADLEMDHLGEQIEDRTDNVNLLEIKISNENDRKELAISSQNKLKAMDGYNSQIDKEYELELRGYDNSIHSLQDELYIEKKRLDQLTEEQFNRQIVAGMEGIVSYIANYQNGDLSDQETTFIKIYNPSTMVFVVDGKYSDLFTLGQEYTVDVYGMEYKVIALSPEDLSPLGNPDEVSQKIYLKLIEDNTSLQSGNQGKITFIINEMNDILYLPLAAVHKEDGNAYVYIEDEGGFKSMKQIEIGTSADKKVEIISGLDEGDKVILK